MFSVNCADIGMTSVPFLFFVSFSITFTSFSLSSLKQKISMKFRGFSERSLYLNIPKNCVRILKWKAGVKIFRRCCHFIPLETSRPSPRNGFKNAYIILLFECFELANNFYEKIENYYDKKIADCCLFGTSTSFARMTFSTICPAM